MGIKLRIIISIIGIIIVLRFLTGSGGEYGYYDVQSGESGSFSFSDYTDVDERLLQVSEFHYEKYVYDNYDMYRVLFLFTSQGKEITISKIEVDDELRYIWLPDMDVWTVNYRDPVWVSIPNFRQINSNDVIEIKFWLIDGEEKVIQTINYIARDFETVIIDMRG